jgi:hypothetical protein
MIDPSKVRHSPFFSFDIPLPALLEVSQVGSYFLILPGGAQMPRPLKHTDFLPYTVLLVIALIGCTVTSPPVSFFSSRPSIKVIEWPFWHDVKVESTNSDHIWTTVMDVLTEHSAIAILEKESGYMQTEWKNRVDKGYNDEWRFTAKIFPEQQLVRVGFEARWVDEDEYVSRIYTDEESLWRQVVKEIEDRL